MLGKVMAFANSFNQDLELCFFREGIVKLMKSEVAVDEETAEHPQQIDQFPRVMPKQRYPF